MGWRETGKGGKYWGKIGQAAGLRELFISFPVLHFSF